MLLGRIVNTAYTLYNDDKGFYVEVEGKKRYVDVRRADHGKEIVTTLIGTTYKVMFFSSPFQYKS